MNYYEHHIGDYDQATAHLSAVEDGIYSRMIRWYMASEAPLPADLKAIARRVRAHTADERAAVQTVLGEFFELRADGYHQHRCDDEVARYKEKQDKAKRSANARWKKGDRTCSDDANAMRTHATSICTEDANGMHRAPVPRHQTPDTNLSSAPSGHQQHGGPPGGPDGPARAVVEAAEAMRRAGLEGVSPGAPELVALVGQGMTPAELAAAAADAVKRGKGFGWALARARGRREDAAAQPALPDAPASGAADPDSRSAIEADGVRFGLGSWSPVDDATGRTVLWSEYADRVRAHRAQQSGAVA